MLSWKLMIAAALAAAGSLPAALTYPGCSDLAGADFQVVDLVGRSATGSPNALVKDSTLLEPLSTHVHTDGRVYWTERTNTGNNTTTGATAVGRLRVFNPSGNTVKTVQSFNVSTSAVSGNAGNPEYGLRSFTMDPGYGDGAGKNKFVYVMYNPRTTVTGRNVDTMLVSRFEMPTPDTLDLASEKKLLRIPFTIGICCHQGGSMDWDAQGNLYVSIGNNTENGDNPLYLRDTIMAQGPGEPKDRATRDNPARVANTMDWRGKILRIKPDNSARGYSIPAGNYWQKYFELGGAWVTGQDTSKILKEIYVVGSRSPWTISVDKPTGWVVFGDVGPDNAAAVANRGPVARDEWNLIRGPGFFGFPYFVGFQQGYNMWNPNASPKAYNLPVQHPDSIYNNSPNNTGVSRLTPALPPLLAACHSTFTSTALAAACNGHPYDMGISTGGTSAASGPIFRYRNDLASTKKMPPHLNGKWLINDGVRHWVKVATLNDSGTAVTAIDDWPGFAALFRGSGAYGLSDFRVGPHDGALYVVGYNANNFASSTNTRISRIEYTGTCLPTNVAVRPGAKGAPDRERLMRGVLFAPGAGAMAWPEGMGRVEAFDLQGRRVFSLARAAGEAEVAVPRRLAAGLLRIRFAP